MSDTPPQASKPTPRPQRQASAPRPPTPPGPVAGHPIGPVKREAAPADLPPGIPPQMAGIIATPRTVAASSGTVAAPARPLHPTFAAPDTARRRLRVQAEHLRTTAQAAAAFTTSQNRALADALAQVKSSPEGIAAAESEGLDLGLLSEFLAVLQKAEALTSPPEK